MTFEKQCELSRSQWERLIDEWIFSERDRRLMKRRLLDGLTYSELETEFNLCERHIKAIVKKQEAILLRHI